MPSKLRHLAISALLLPGVWAEPRVRVDPSTQSFKDASGRTLIFHGINVVGKYSRKEQELSEKQMDVMQALGFNVVRLGLSWDLYETAPGKFDDTYLDFVEGQVNALGKRGMLSFIDMHQDLMAAQYCGHGAPEWHMWPSASKDFYKGGKWAFPQPITAPEYGPDDAFSGQYGRIKNCGAAQSGKLGWAEVYMTHALSNAAQLLYNNESGRLDAFKVFWQRVARRFKSNPHILAYELINEPWVGDAFANPDLLVPSHADKVNMQPFYDKLHAAIRQEDNETIIFFEPSTGGNVLDTTHYGADATPGGDGYREKTALSYHVYCPWIQTDVPGTSSGELKEKLCEKFNKWQFGIRHDDTKRLKVAGILSEFGAVDAKNPAMQKFLDFTMNAMDSQQHSWTYWYMHPQEDGKNPEAPVLARTFARAVAGEVLRMEFDRDSAAFTLEFVADTSVSTPTEVFASLEHYYTNGFSCTLTPTSAGTVHIDGGIVQVQHAPNLPKDTKVTLTITRKSASTTGNWTLAPPPSAVQAISV